MGKFIEVVKAKNVDEHLNVLKTCSVEEFDNKTDFINTAMYLFGQGIELKENEMYMTKNNTWLIAPKSKNYKKICALK